MSVELSRLPNGLTVVSHARADVETVSLGIWIGAGSRSESLPEQGVAHFLEHMAFKGTARRSAQDIAEEIEAVGGELNAATGVDSTAYYARVLREDLGLTLDILSDIILTPRFDRAELARERDVILQEIASAQDSPEDMVFDLVQSTAFPDQPAGRPILGTVDSVKGFKSSHLKSYLSTHYQAPNMVLAAAGAVDHEKLLAAAERLLGSLGTGTAPEPAPALYRGGVARSEKPFEQTHMVLAFEAPPYRHADYFAAQVCAGALGEEACPRACSRRYVRSGGFAMRSTLSPPAFRTPVCSRSTRLADRTAPRSFSPSCVTSSSAPPIAASARRRSVASRPSSRWGCLPGSRAAAREPSSSPGKFSFTVDRLPRRS